MFRLFKISIFTWILLTTNTVNTKSYQGRSYIYLSQIKKKVSQVKFTFDQLSLVLEASYAHKQIQLQIESDFYVSGNQHYSIQKPMILHKGKVMLSQAMIEELMTEFGLKVNYRFSKQKLIVKKRKQEPKPNVHRNAKTGLDFIVLDAGHGGHDPGARGALNSKEKVITLKVGRYVYSHLKKVFPHTRIYVTRLRDRFISLERRSAIANRKIKRKRFGIFISLHCNATLDRKSVV